MDFDSLRCFDAAATQLNFRRAAKAVALSPTAFSERIARLEETLGTKLFVRTTRQVSLSAAGVALQQHARRVFAEVDACVAAVKGGPQPYVLSVGTRFELGLSWLTPSLQRLQNLTPSRRIHLHFGDSADLVERVRVGLLDCVVTSARLTHSWSRYAALHREDYVFVATPGLLRSRPLRGADDARSHTLIDLHPDLPLFRYLLDAAAPGQLFRFQDHEYLGAIAAVRARVLAHQGVAVLPSYFVADDLRQKRLVRVLPKLPLHSDAFRLVWREGHIHEDRLELLAQQLLAMPLR